MKQSKKFILLVILFISLFLSGTAAQNIWSLEDCIEYAYDNNIQIKQQVVNTRYQENLLNQSRIALAPDLSAGVSQNFTWGRGLDLTTYRFTEGTSNASTNFSVGSSVTLFRGFQQLNTIDRNELDLMASVQDLEKIKNDISIALASAYLQILFNKELLLMAENQLDITNQQVERTAKLVEAGSLARGSLLEIKAQAADEELNVITATNALDISYLNLTQLLDLDSVGDFEIEIPVFEDFRDPINFSVRDVYRDALARLPEVKASQYRLESAEEELNIARGMRSPSLTLNGSWGTGYSRADKLLDPATLEEAPYPFEQQLTDKRNTLVGLRLDIPIFNRWMTETQISNARLGVLNSELVLETTKMDLYKEIQQKYTDAVAARKKFLAAEEALIAMEESFKYTEEKFEVGMVNTVEYNQEKNRLILTQSDLLRNKYDYIFKMKILDFYRGIPITL